MPLTSGLYNIRFVSNEPRFHDRNSIKATGVGEPLVLSEPGVLPRKWDVKRQEDGNYTIVLEPGTDGFSWSDTIQDGEAVILGEPRRFNLERTDELPDGHYNILIPQNPRAGILPVSACVGVSPKPTPTLSSKSKDSKLIHLRCPYGNSRQLEGSFDCSQ
ncbi:hypothetical protein BD779DRAFT_1807624 [Infundibulicybe gibba]|nr:hypothetical protein BD779DRAFT_1807624 [Infundibulicybe gibba]